MNTYSLIDTHCDTAYELYHRQQTILQNHCHIDLKKSECYEHYAQFFAIWTNRRISDDAGFDAFLKIAEYFQNNIALNCDKIVQARTFSDLERAWSENKIAAFLAVEDARLLGGKLERMDTLRDLGVKYLTLMWGGTSCIGASHNVSGGLSPFGRDVVRKCFEYGILPDISHSNEQTTDDVCALAYEYNKPFIATHSNCYSVYPHSRNLREKHLKAIIELGGIVGFSLCPPHLTDTSEKECTTDDVVRHIDKYLELGAENVLGFGCDLDGTDLPAGYSSVNDLQIIGNALADHGYSDELIEKIFYKNYYEFIKRNF